MKEEHGNHFAIGSRREYLLGEKCTQGRTVDQIPVMGDRDGVVATALRTDDEWTCILNTTRTGCGVAYMTDAAMCKGQTCPRIRKDLTYFSHTYPVRNLHLAVLDFHASTL